jgi:hypothetical protein
VGEAMMISSIFTAGATGRQSDRTCERPLQVIADSERRDCLIAGFVSALVAVEQHDAAVEQVASGL